MKAPTSGRVLDSGDAALVKGMINRGDRQHDIASYFGVNGGRIGEASTGENFAAVAPAVSGLPPASPYLVVSGDLRAIARGVLASVQGGLVDAKVVEDLKLIVDAMDASFAARHGV